MRVKITAIHEIDAYHEETLTCESGEAEVIGMTGKFEQTFNTGTPQGFVSGKFIPEGLDLPPDITLIFHAIQYEELPNDT